MRLILALILTACPALAQDAPVLDPAAAPDPGAVALYLQAERLYALGQADKDPLLVLTAARLLHGISLTDTPRQPDPAPKAAPSVTALDAAQMLDTARALDAGEVYGDLIDMLTREVPPHPRALRATASTLEPGATEVWTLPFFGGTYGELAILGDGKSNLDMVVSGPGDTQICLDRGSSDVALCGFVLTENGTVTVSVTNAGGAVDSYLLLTE